MGFEQIEYKTAADQTDKRFDSTSVLENSSTTSTEEKTLTCDLCPNLVFSLTSELKRHRKTVHKGMNTFLCKLCSKGFAKAPQRDRHMIVHTKEKKFQCNICNKQFTQRCGLVGHNQTHHQITVSYDCKVCSKSFRKRFELRRHIKKAHYTPEVFYPCLVCSKSFKYPSGLKSHLSSHESVRPFTCSLCNKTFKKMRNLCKHKKSAHPEASS